MIQEGGVVRGDVFDLHWGTRGSLMSYQVVQQGLNEPSSSLTSTAEAKQQCNPNPLVVTGKADSSSSIGYEGLWRAHIRGTLPGGGAGEPQARPPVPSQGYGSSLSTSDMEGVARFLEEFAVRALLPHLEVRVRNLNHQVSIATQQETKASSRLTVKQFD